MIVAFLIIFTSVFGEVGRHGRAGPVIVAFLIIFTSVFGEVARHGSLGL